MNISRDAPRDRGNISPNLDGRSKNVSRSNVLPRISPAGRHHTRGSFGLTHVPVIRASLLLAAFPFRSSKTSRTRRLSDARTWAKGHPRSFVIYTFFSPLHQTFTISDWRCCSTIYIYVLSPRRTPSFLYYYINKFVHEEGALFFLILMKKIFSHSPIFTQTFS